MLGDQGNGQREEDAVENEVRDIYALTPQAPPAANQGRRREAWETGSLRSSNLSLSSEGLSENFTTMSREFNALVLAGSAIDTGNGDGGNNGTNLARIGEEFEETNPLAIVADSNPIDHAPSSRYVAGSSSTVSNQEVSVAVHMVKKEETESKIMAWQTAEIAKINNRFKREEAIISGLEGEEIQKASTRFKKTERKLEEKKAKAMEKMQNEVAKARRKAEEKRASAEAKRGTKVARIFEGANLMKAVGRVPSKRSFF